MLQSEFFPSQCKVKNIVIYVDKKLSNIYTGEQIYPEFIPLSYDHVTR